MTRKLKIHPCLKEFPMKYFGCKSRFVDDILAVTPEDTETFIDLFGGTMCVGFAVKKLRGAKIISTDILRFNSLKGRVLIENNKTLLTDGDLKMLTTPNSAKGNSVEKMYVQVFGRRNSEFLDNYVANILKLSDPIKKDIAVMLPIVCMTKHLKFAATHISGNATIAGSQQFFDVNFASEIIQFAKERLPRLINDNGQSNEIHNVDALGLLDRITGQVCYCDVPYCGNSSYENDNSVWDDFVRLFSNKAHEILNRTDGKCELGPHTDFEKRPSSLVGFADIFKKAKHIPLIILSYNTTSGIAVSEIETIARGNGRTVNTQYIDYIRPIRKKNNNRFTKEALIVCSNDRNSKPNFYMPETLAA